MELLNTLGINGWLLMWQVILFLVLLFLLKTFAYKPILTALDEREARLKKGLADAAQAGRDAAEAAKEKETTLRAAAQEAEKMVGTARTDAETLRAEMLAEAKAEVEQALVHGRSQLDAERAAMLRGVEAELSGVVHAATEKVLARTVTGADHEKLVAEAVAVATQARV